MSIFKKSSVVTEDAILDRLLEEESAKGESADDAIRIAACRSGMRSGLPSDVLLQHYGIKVFQEAAADLDAELVRVDDHAASAPTESKQVVVVPDLLMEKIGTARSDRLSFQFAAVVGLVLVGVLVATSMAFQSHSLRTMYATRWLINKMPLPIEKWIFSRELALEVQKLDVTARKLALEIERLELRLAASKSRDQARLEQENMALRGTLEELRKYRVQLEQELGQLKDRSPN